jgi:SAM-dependent methyltransferase
VTDPSIYDAAYFERMRGARTIAEPGAPPLDAEFLSLVCELPVRGLRVLDAGCGRGELLVGLRRAGARSVTGCDFSAEAVDRSRERLRRAFGPGAGGVRVVQAPLQDRATFEPESFDLVILADVVEHLPAPELRAALANVAEWLAPGGRALVHTFPTLALHRLYNGLMRLAGCGADVDRSNRIHCNVQTRRRLRRALSSAGLACERLWLRNDLLRTSSAYQAMRPGPLKRAARLLACDLPSWPPLRALAAATGLAELVSPSIYCWCRKASAPPGAPDAVSGAQAPRSRSASTTIQGAAS